MSDTPEAAAIDDAVESLRPELVAFIQELVRIPSLPGEEEAAHRFAAARLEALGLEVDIVPSRFDELRHHPAFCDDGLRPEGRINVVAGWRGDRGRGQAARSLILNGHLDVVSVVDEALWTDSPWSGRVRDGRIHGRGACDMKSGVACAIFAVAALKRLRFSPSGDVLVETVSGEESGGVGTLTTIVKGYRADAAVVLEPTSLTLCPVQSGALTFRLTVTGRSTHACMKSSGVSAIDKAYLLIRALDQLDAERHRRTEHPLYADPMNVAPICVGRMSAGEWHSTVAHTAVLEGRCGVMPGEEVTAARRELERAIERASAGDAWLRDHPPSVEWIEGQFESGQTDLGAPILATLGRSHRRVTGAEPALAGVTYGSDLRLFTRHAGIPTVLYGPGAVADAHTVDESIGIDEVVTATKVIALTIGQWCGGARFPEP
jgi:acetylornithine deacetylase